MMPLFGRAHLWEAAGRQAKRGGTMLVNDARGNPVIASDPLPVSLLDDAVEAHLGFRKASARHPGTEAGAIRPFFRRE
jgi:hypothetical protein